MLLQQLLYVFVRVGLFELLLNLLEVSSCEHLNYLLNVLRIQRLLHLLNRCLRFVGHNNPSEKQTPLVERAVQLVELLEQRQVAVPHERVLKLARVACQAQEVNQLLLLPLRNRLCNLSL